MYTEYCRIAYNIYLTLTAHRMKYAESWQASSAVDTGPRLRVPLYPNPSGRYKRVPDIDDYQPTLFPMFIERRRCLRGIGEFETDRSKLH